MSLLADLEGAPFQTPARSSSLAPPSVPAETPTTDFHLLESQKENIRPLSTGRSASTLSDLFTKDRSEAEAQVSAGHDFFRALIKEATRREDAGEEMEDDVSDVLDPYVRYIAFIHQNHPSSHTILLPILESTTRKFISDDRFAQDLRYLRLWVQYAQMVEIEQREDVWVFLNSREIGTRHALFYEEWAAACEGRGRSEKAEEAFRIGIARKAQPLKRLQTNQKAFQNRPIRVQQEAQLASSSSDQAHASVGASASAAAQARKVLAARSVSTSSTTLAQGSSSTRTPIPGQPKNGARLDIFIDSAEPSDAATSASPSSAWDDLGTREGNRKENTVEAVGWKGETLPQSAKAAARIAPRTPKMEVFKDSGDGEGGVVVKMRSADEQFSRGKMTPHEVEALRADPLRYYASSGAGDRKNTDELPVLPVPSNLGNQKPHSKNRNVSGGSSSAPAFEKSTWSVPDEGRDVTGKTGKIERRMFEWDQVFKYGDEWSFEEVRARRAGLLAVPGKEVKEWEKSWHAPGSSTPKPISRTQPPLSFPLLSSSSSSSSSAAMPSSSSSTTPPPPRQLPVQKKSVPSPTVNTKAAMADVYELFNQTVNAGGSRSRPDSDDDDDDDSDSDDDDDDDDDDMPTQAAQPTPLPPPRSASADFMLRQAAMSISTPGQFVPPTPTPAQGYLGSRKPAQPDQLPVFIDENAVLSQSASGKKPMIFMDENAHAQAQAHVQAPAVFIDENAILSSARKPSVFGVTPAKTPLASKSVLGEKTPLKIFSDHQVIEPPTNTINQTPLQPRTGVFSQQTPVSTFQRSQPVRRGVFTDGLASKITEEQEEEEENPHANAIDQGYEEEDENGYNPRRVVRCGGAFDLMTPITERTVEYTTSTQAFTMRQSISGQQGIRHQVLTEGDSDEEEDVPPRSGAAAAQSQNQQLSTVKEELEHGSIRSRSESVGMPPADDATMPRNPEMRRSPSIDRSGRDESPFNLSPGHTIQHTASAMDTLFIDDIKKPFSSRTEAPQKPVAMHSTTNQSHFQPPNPCCPADSDIVSQLIRSLNPPVQSLPGFVDCQSINADKLDALQKHAKSRIRRNSTASARKTDISTDSPWLLDLHGQVYEIQEKVGEGGFGAVFKAIDLAARQVADDASDDEDDEVNPEAAYTLAIKVEKPANLWEAAILDRIRTRLPHDLQPSVVKSRGLYCYQDESMLLLDYYSQGTLLDAVNKAQTLGIASLAAGATPGMEEILAVFFTIELLRLVEGMHGADFLHGDLKIDNCLLRLEDVDGWSAQYDRNGSKGWSSKGIRVIDFGRAIDLTMYPAGRSQTFIADWPTDARDCQEIREGRLWNYQTDYYGLASICYCMLFGKYISTEVAPAQPEDGNVKRYRIQGTLKRYWQIDLWNTLFDLLLNPKLTRPDRDFPLNDELATIRGEFETWLEANCSKSGKSLKGMLTKIELSMMSR